MNVQEGKPGEVWRIDDTRTGAYGVWKIIDEDERQQLGIRCKKGIAYAYALGFGNGKGEMKPRPAFYNLKELANLTTRDEQVWTLIASAELVSAFPSYEFSE